VRYSVVDERVGWLGNDTDPAGLNIGGRLIERNPARDLDQILHPLLPRAALQLRDVRSVPYQQQADIGNLRAK